MLANISDDYGTTLSQIDTLNLEKTKIQKDNESLRDTNMRLFLKVGDTVLNPVPPAGEEGEEINNEGGQTISFEDLFDEKGELK